MSQTDPVEQAHASLISAIYQPYMADWTADTAARIRNTVEFITAPATASAQVRAAQVGETQITTLLRSLTTAESALVTLIWATSDRHLGRNDPLPAGAQLYRLEDFLSRGVWRRPKELGAMKLPDLLIAHPDPRDNRSFTERRLVLDVVVEVKGMADVNSDYGYCLDDDTQDAYSNQAICYPHGCWVNLKDRANAFDFRAARFVWIGPDKYIDHPEGRGVQGLGRGGPRAYDSGRGTPIDPAIELQRQAKALWAGLELSMVERTLRSVGGGNAVLADVMASWRAEKRL